MVPQIWRVKDPTLREWKGIKEKLVRSQKGLVRWQKVNKDPSEGLITRKMELLCFLQGAKGIPDLEEVRKIKMEVNELMGQVDLKWRQWAKEH